MRKLILTVAAAVLLATPALASDGPDSRSPDPESCAHSFVCTEVRPANCTEPGLAAYTCSLCGFTYTEPVPPNGEHVFVLTDTTATCTEPGEATFTCAACGETYAEPAPAAGHVPEEEPASCTRSRLCAVCGQVLEQAPGHDYAYQYDAVLDEDGSFISYGTWRCANCGETLTATRGNALYYAGGDAAVPAAGAASSTDLPYEERVSPTDSAGGPAGGSQRGLWTAISAGVLAFILIEAVLLVRSLRKNKTTI